MEQSWKVIRAAFSICYYKVFTVDLATYSTFLL